MVEIQWYYSDTQKYNKNIWDQPYEKRKWIKLDMATIIKQSSCFVYSMIELHEFHIFYKKILFSEKNRFVSRITFNIPSRTSEIPWSFDRNLFHFQCYYRTIVRTWRAQRAYLVQQEARRVSRIQLVKAESKFESKCRGTESIDLYPSFSNVNRINIQDILINLKNNR